MVLQSCVWVWGTPWRGLQIVLQKLPLGKKGRFWVQFKPLLKHSNLQTSPWFPRSLHRLASPLGRQEITSFSPAAEQSWHCSVFSIPYGDNRKVVTPPVCVALLTVTDWLGFSWIKSFVPSMPFQNPIDISHISIPSLLLSRTCTPHTPLRQIFWWGIKKSFNLFLKKRWTDALSGMLLTYHSNAKENE